MLSLTVNHASWDEEQRVEKQYRPTIKDIAERAGVSKMTVSAVLGGSKTVRVSEATRQRVLDVVKQVGYRPNIAARNLRRRRTDILGIYTRYGYLNGRSYFLTELLGGLQEGCDTHQKDLLLHGAFHGHSTERILSELADGRVDGLVLLTNDDDPLVPLLIDSGLPAVAIVDAVPGLPSVVADDASGMRQIVEYLAGQGHRSFFYRDRSYPRVSAQCRLLSFRETVAALGLEAVESVALDTLDRLTPPETEWMRRPRAQRPTAAVCWNDAAADDLLRHCRSRGLRVPEDLAVTGYDGVTPAGYDAWLTTVRAPWLQVARTAVDLLMRRIEGEALPAETALPVELILGDTT